MIDILLDEIKDSIQRTEKIMSHNIIISSNFDISSFMTFRTLDFDPITIYRVPCTYRLHVTYSIQIKRDNYF